MQLPTGSVLATCLDYKSGHRVDRPFPCLHPEPPVKDPDCYQYRVVPITRGLDARSPLCL